MATGPKSAALRDLSARGFIEQLTDEAAIDAALDAGRVRFYIGFDPTAISLHVGNLVPVMAMRRLQQHGHIPIALVGGGTTRVGDPSGKTETRRVLDEDTIDRQALGVGKQLRAFLDFDEASPNAATMVDNKDWLLQQRYIEFLRDVGVHFTVNRMIAMKTYRDRLQAEQPLSFLEFNYQLLQSYDFLHLYRERACTMQAGGGDQWGNMVAGVELIRRATDLQHGPAQCITFPLLTTADGRKMGKTERGAVWIDAELLAPYDYFQYWVSCADADVRRMLLTFTDLPVDEIEELCRAEGAALRDVKTRLAVEATTIAHGAEEATKAKTAAVQAFGGSDDWSAVPAVEVEGAPIKLVDLVVHEAVAAFKSKREARQRIESGAVKIDGEPHKDPAQELTAEDFPAEGLRLQVGKKTRMRVTLAS